MRNARFKTIGVALAILALSLVSVSSAFGTSEAHVSSLDISSSDMTMTVSSIGDAGQDLGNTNNGTSPIDSIGAFLWFNQPVTIDWVVFPSGDWDGGGTWGLNFTGSGYTSPTALPSDKTLGYEGVYSIVATGTGGVTGTVEPAFGIDMTDPVVTTDVKDQTAWVENGTTFYTGATTMTVEATDAMSGVENASLSYDLLSNFLWMPSDPTPFSADVPFSGEGEHTLKWVVHDNAGNAATGSTSFSIDNVPPVTTSNTAALYNGPGTITLSPTDLGGSGVAHTYYRFVIGDFTGAVQEGTTAQVPVPASGFTTPTIEFWSVDHVGNVEATEFAEFRVNSQHAITAVAPSGGYITPAGSTLVNYGASQTYSITPATGYHITGVYVDSVNVGAVGSYTFPNVNAIHTIAASFAINTYTITPQKSNSQGSISPSSRQTVNYGGSKRFSFKPKSHYKVSKVLVNGRNIGHPGAYTVSNVKQNTTIKVYFVHK
jgi:hypothetical protein